MKKLIFLAFTFCTLTYTVTGQIPQWGWVLQGDGYSFGQYVRCDINDEIVIAGSLSGNLNMNPVPGDSMFISIPQGAHAVCLAKYDAAGLLKWAFPLITDTDTTSSIQLTGMDVDLYNRNIYITGNFTGTVDVDPDTGVIRAITASTPVASGTFSDIFLICYSPDGNYLWHKIIRGPSLFDVKPGNVAFSQNGRIAITGRYNGELDFDDANSGTADSLHGSTNPQDLLYYLARYDQNGNFIDVQETAGGQQIAFNQNGEIISCRDSVITHYDDPLNFVWSVTMDCPNGGTVGKAVCDLQNNTIVSASFADSVTINGITYKDPGMPLVNIVMSIDQNGTVNWVKNFPYRTPGIPLIAVTPASEVFIAGLFRDSIDLAPGQGVSGSMVYATDRDMFFAYYDYTGAFLNGWSIGDANSTHMPYDLSCDLSGNMIVLGDQMGTLDIDPGSSTFLLNNNGHDEHIAMFKYTPVANAVHGIPYVQNNPLAFPNPFESRIILDAKDKNFDGIITILDMNGKMVCEFENVSGGRVTWDGNNACGTAVPSGIYCITFANGRSVQTFRVAKL